MFDFIRNLLEDDETVERVVKIGMFMSIGGFFIKTITEPARMERKINKAVTKHINALLDD